MKKIICMILALVLCVGLLVGCGAKEETTTTEPVEEVNKMEAFEQKKEEEKKEEVPAEEAEEVEYAETFVRLSRDKIPMVNPYNVGGRCICMGEVYNNVYDTLITLTSSYEYLPGLATEWSTEDFQHFNFKLRQGVKFHNGEEFTADDVVFNWELGKTVPGVSAYDRAKKIESIEVVNDYEINMTLYDTNFDWWYEMANPIGFVMCNREACEADIDNGPMIGTGPYKITEMVSSDHVSFERFDDYWGEKATTKYQVMRYIAEDTAKMIMVENGEADATPVSEVNIPKYESDDNYIVNYVFNSSCGYISFNCNRPITGDINFRMACAYCFNVQEFIDIALAGYGKAQPNCTLWGAGAAYYNYDIPAIEQNLELAKEYLAKSNYNGEKVELVATLGYLQAVAQVAMAQMQAIGINAYVTECDTPTLTTRSLWDNNDIDMLVMQQMFGPVANAINIAITENNSNKAHWINDEVVDLVAKTTIEPDGEERQEHYYRIQEIMYEEMPYFPTYHVGIFDLERAGVGGVDLWPTGNNDFSNAYRVISK